MELLLPLNLHKAKEKAIDKWTTKQHNKNMSILTGKTKIMIAEDDTNFGPV